MLACLLVTLCMKGATVWSSRRAWLTGAGAFAATMIAAAGLATPALGGVQPPPGAPAAAFAADPAIALDTATASDPDTASDPAIASVAVRPALSGPMVALGDSYTAGALLPSELTARPLGCLRSTKAYPVLVAAALGASLTDAACASAGVGDMTAAQKTHIGTNPAH